MRLLRWLLIVIAGGALAGLVWAWVAEPPVWEVLPDGLTMSERGAQDQFAVVLTFCAVGLFFSLLWGISVGILDVVLGWRSVVVALAGAVIASLVAWRVGVFAGPSTPESVGGIELGDTVPTELSVDMPSAFVVWPLAAAAGVLLVALFGRSGQTPAGAALDGEHDDGAETVSTSPGRRLDLQPPAAGSDAT